MVKVFGIDPSKVCKTITVFSQVYSIQVRSDAVSYTHLDVYKRQVHEGDVLDSVSASVTEHFTTPPKQYTEDTLLSAMETAGNDQFDDDTEKKGLGTPATRAGIIEKLVKSGFAERKGKSLIPTKDGCNLVCVLPEQITSPAMTAEWENTLMEIERGNADADAFLSGIVQMTGDLVKAYPFLSDAEAQRFGTGKEEIGKCPRCGSPVYVCLLYTSPRRPLQHSEKSKGAGGTAHRNCP